MEEGSVAVLVDAKEEYTKQLNNILKPCIYQGIKSIFLDSKNICDTENTPDNVLMTFQDLLSRIPKWSQEIINKEYERIVEESKCDWIEDLLKVIYLAHIKVLTIVHSSQNNKKISLQVPTGSHFMHLCYTETAREFWKNPYLFSDRVTKFEYQNNMRTCENIINDCICETIRKQLPVRHILKEYLGDFENDGEATDDEDDIKKPISSKYMRRLETMVKKELKNEDSVKNIIDQDDIRRIIKEELSVINAVKEDNLEEKEEIVSNVVEKLKEEVENENLPTDLETSNVSITSSNLLPVAVDLTSNTVVSNDDNLTVSNLVEEIPDLELEELDVDTQTENEDSSKINTETPLEQNTDLTSETTDETTAETTTETTTNSTTETTAETTIDSTSKIEAELTTSSDSSTDLNTTQVTNIESQVNDNTDAELEIKPPNYDESSSNPVVIPVTSSNDSQDDSILKIDEIEDIDLDLNELNNIDEVKKDNSIEISPLDDISSLDDLGLEEIDTSGNSDELAKLNNNKFSFFN
jgi:hypothetical protein